MLACHSCNRHYRATDGRCPFCGTMLQTISAPGLGMTAALAIGLSMFACTDDNDTGSADYGGPETSDDIDVDDSETGSDTAEATADNGGVEYAGPDTESSDTGDGTSSESGDSETAG
jgi:hypothetical protein